MLEKGRSWQSFSMEIGLDQGLQCRKIRPNRPRYQDYAARLEMFQRNSQHLLRLRVRSVSHDIHTVRECRPRTFGMFVCGSYLDNVYVMNCESLS
jgi:hypothetical protein